MDVSHQYVKLMTSNVKIYKKLLNNNFINKKSAVLDIRVMMELF